MLLLNKADLLTREQRHAWAEHFQKEGIRAVFWSALAEAERLDAEEKVRTCFVSETHTQHSDTKYTSSVYIHFKLTHVFWP